MPLPTLALRLVCVAISARQFATSLPRAKSPPFDAPVRKLQTRAGNPDVTQSLCWMMWVRVLDWPVDIYRTALTALVWWYPRFRYLALVPLGPGLGFHSISCLILGVGPSGSHSGDLAKSLTTIARRLGLLFCGAPVDCGSQESPCSLHHSIDSVTLCASIAMLARVNMLSGNHTQRRVAAKHRVVVQTRLELLSTRSSLDVDVSSTAEPTGVYCDQRC